jgi:hypothetical protein
MSISFNVASSDTATAAAQSSAGAQTDTPPASTAGNLALASAAAFLMMIINQMQAEMSKLSSQVTTLQSNYAAAIQGNPNDPTSLAGLLKKLNDDTAALQGMTDQGDISKQTGVINTDNADYGARSSEGQQIQKSIDQSVQVIQGFLSQLPTGEQQFVQFMQTVVQGLNFIASLISR